MVMVRKTATAILVLALLLLGYQPISVPMAGAMAATTDMEQPCCPDCDEPTQSDQAPCGALAGCALRCTPAPSSTILPTIAMPAFFLRAMASPVIDDLVIAADGAIPPFRPPRPSILA